MSGLNYSERLDTAMIIAEEIERFGLPPPLLSANEELGIDISYEEQGIFATLEPQCDEFRLRVRPIKSFSQPEEIRITTYSLLGSPKSRAEACASWLKTALESQTQK